MASPSMKLFLRILATVAAAALVLELPRLLAAPEAASAADALARPELEYLKAVNLAAPPRDPQVLLLLMAQYANANRHGEGAAFVASLLERHRDRLAPRQRAHYLGATAVLRAGHADAVPLFSRIDWVRETIGMLREARRLAGEDDFTVRWMSGVVFAQVPGFFGMREAAEADLAWCVGHAQAAPHPGWLREVHFQLAVLRRALGDDEAARRHLAASGYAGFTKDIVLTTPFTREAATGHRFSARRVREVVPGRVFALSGFEFTEYYYFVTRDGRELVGIDAGTRADSAREAYEALRRQAPALPPLTTILVTHAHWDHVGGHRFFRGLEPPPRFVASSAWREELRRATRAPAVFLPAFFGSRFDLADVASFRPDETVSAATGLVIGGTRVELVPASGGETPDALMVHVPELGVMFLGDVVMPYLGAPFVEEGDLDGLLQAIDAVAARRPRHLLHGHEPLTRLFHSPEILLALKRHLAWTRDRVVEAVAKGESRGAIHRRNLLPPGLATGDPDVVMPYFVMRENVIDRLYDQLTGYWQADLQGVSHLESADRGAIVLDYLDVPPERIARAARRLVAEGRHEMAAELLEWTSPRLAGDESVQEARRLAYRKLMEKFQEFNPFKLIVYADRIGEYVAPAGGSGDRD